MKAAFFDLDGTLFTGHIWRGIAQHHRLHRMHRGALYIYLTTHLALWPLCRLGLLSQEWFFAAWARHMAWTIAGLSEERALRVFDWLADQYVLPLLRPDVVALLKEHQAQGHMAILVSGTFQDLLEVIGERLGVGGHAVGTRLEVRRGRYTGRIIEPVCLGHGKVKRLREFLANHQDVDLDASYAYADSIFDVPLLELVRHPVAVYPDPRLAAYAADRGWMVLGKERVSDK